MELIIRTASMAIRAPNLFFAHLIALRSPLAASGVIFDIFIIYTQPPAKPPVATLGAKPLKLAA